MVLPGTSFAEGQGSYTNLEGRVQLLRPPLDVEPPRRQGWEVLAELAAHLGLELDYPGIFALQKEAAVVYPELIGMAGVAAAADGATPVLLGAARP